VLPDVILPRQVRQDPGWWDIATRIGGGGCMAFLAAGAYVGLQKTANLVTATSLTPALAAQFLAGGFLFLLLITQATLIFTRPPALRKASGLQPRITALLGTWLVGLVILLPLRQDLPAFISALAAGLGGIGDALALVIVFHLGRSFSIMAEARRFVAHGPYRLVRHPLYLAEELGLLNAVLLHWSPWAGLLFAIQMLCQLQRIRNEERVLLATFPGYGPYRARVPMLVPHALRGSWR
jgi:protein-S-isoprenylcysteine O-methyltransferase Ste14